MNLLTKQKAASFLSLSILILMCLFVGDKPARAQIPAKCGCLQTLTATSDSADLSYYDSNFSLSTTDPETQSNWLRLETLTGGQWVELDLSQPMINTTSQPLRISYVHTDPKQQKLEASLVLKQFLTKATLDSDVPRGEAAQSAGFKLQADAIPKSSYKLKNLNSVVIPRLTPGVYLLELNEFKQKKTGWKKKPMAPKWLQVLPTTPEPPQLVSINRRLAAQGKLTLKLKNIVVGDHIRFYVDGEELYQKTMTTEAQLNQFMKIPNSLPPGRSKITAQLYRGNQWSNDSSPVSVNSRATVFMTRQIDVNEKDFDKSSPKKLDKDRQNSPRAFQFAVSDNTASAEAGNDASIPTTPAKRQEDQCGYTILSHLSFLNNLENLSFLNNWNLTFYKPSSASSLTEVTQKLDQLVKGQKNEEIIEATKELSRELAKRNKFERYLHSNWKYEPVVVWQNYARYKESYQFPDKALDQTHFSDKFETPQIEEENFKAFIESCKKNNAFTLDITFQAMNPEAAKKELRRIITLSQNQSKRNFTLGQIGKDLVFRLRTNGDSKTKDDNGMSRIVTGSNNEEEGIHFFTDLVKGETYNVVVSFSDQKLRFWVKNKNGLLSDVKHIFAYTNGITGWDSGFKLKLGNEHAANDKNRQWQGTIHSFSLRDVGVTLPRPDEECAQFLFPAAQAAGAGKTETTESCNQSENSPVQSAGLADTKSDPSEKKITIKEFAFPYPASFPVPRFNQRGNKIETEGVVLDQMRLAIAEDGTYRIDFQARTTMRADINLQLLVKLEDNRWYPITLPRKTILPENYENFTTGSNSSPQIQPISIKGYAPVFVASSGEIVDIRRRGNAVFGTRPPLTTQYHKTNCCDQKPPCSPAASTKSQESSCSKQSETK